MDVIFEKIFVTLSELVQIQDFVAFGKKLPEMIKCGEENCDMELFLKQLDEIFNEELSFDLCRVKFTKVCISRIAIFHTIFRLYKRCGELDFLNHSETIIKVEFEHNKKLMKFILEKYIVQQENDSVVKKLF